VNYLIRNCKPQPVAFFPARKKRLINLFYVLAFYTRAVVFNGNICFAVFLPGFYLYFFFVLIKRLIRVKRDIIKRFFYKIRIHARVKARLCIVNNYHIFYVFRQFKNGFFHKFAGKDYEDKRPRDRYAAESKRLLGVLEQRLTGRRWVMGDEYTIADIAIFPWVRNLVGFYGAGELVEFERFPQVQRALAAFVERPAVQRGLAIPARD